MGHGLAKYTKQGTENLIKSTGYQAILLNIN
jgi:hypothetical protein